MPRVQLPDGRIVQFPEGMSEDDMASALRTLDQPERDTLDKAAEWLPTVGAGVGGMAGAAGGPVTAIGLAGLGGAAGRAAQRTIEGLRGRQTPQGMDLAADVGLEGGKQAAMQAIGGVVGKGLAKGAGRLYQGLAKPVKGLREEFPDLIPTALKERILLTRGGAKRVESKLAESAGQAKQAIAHAESLGAPPVQPKEVIPAYRNVVGELRKRADIGQPSELPSVGARGKRLIERNPLGIPLSRAQELKQTAQTAAQGAYRAKDRGIAKELSGSDLLDEATAKGLRGAIEKRVPEIAGINKRTQSLLGVDRMLEGTLGREGNTLGVGGMRDLIAAGAGGGLGSVVGMPAEGAAAGLLLRLLSAPGTGSAAAIGMNELSRLPHAQVLRLLRQTMASHDTQE